MTEHYLSPGWKLTFEQREALVCDVSLIQTVKGVERVIATGTIVDAEAETISIVTEQDYVAVLSDGETVLRQYVKGIFTGGWPQ